MPLLCTGWGSLLRARRAGDLGANARDRSNPRRTDGGAMHPTCAAAFCVNSSCKYARGVTRSPWRSPWVTIRKVALRVNVRYSKKKNHNLVILSKKYNQLSHVVLPASKVMQIHNFISTQISTFITHCFIKFFYLQLRSFSLKLEMKGNVNG